MLWWFYENILCEYVMVNLWCWKMRFYDKYYDDFMCENDVMMCCDDLMYDMMWWWDMMYWGTSPSSYIYIYRYRYTIHIYIYMHIDLR